MLMIIHIVIEKEENEENGMENKDSYLDYI